ncbi:MAG: NAD(P)/FAD-dependent oxidoreductase [Gammaproteobacteria bacterium]|nr:NAD(P)/FAD-dependent oxidoreductase [Gammaproteobacteria bacterium]MBT5223116.1 NAD(P)/FAD-dependent oxidoreductase [Gammaproteobacteria bacterium]MBT6420574.1 NAD(P)/FAD-dependent oxidoreductase [Gammaproteobacteria bacterium]MBT6574637.1 NAD(P)/FAD-dependent oxidoreductase [Gammaproteobacteria bacterium]MBT7436411.1 NAD(P)/FAD-dependent oxidoreductase [Gammaproteobacteria bacterium]
MLEVDVIIIGAGASGLMCAIEAGKRQRRVLVLEATNKPGKKILMSGGGRCNFTNYTVEAENFISENAHFCKSALSRFTQWDFLEMIHAQNIPYHEREHGQLFCNESARDILNMLLSECDKVGVDIQLKADIQSIKKHAELGFMVKTKAQEIHTQSLVIATGGLSIPKMGATPFAYKIAEQFDIKVQPTRAGLVPFTLHVEDKEKFAVLSGLALVATISNACQSFTENLLFTHRGLSGPVALQMSSYWQEGEELVINLLPDLDLQQQLLQAQQEKIKLKLKNYLAHRLAKRLVSTFLQEEMLELSVLDLSHKQIQQIAQQFNHWTIKPNGTEGYRTAEVTLGGVDCHAISSKTLEANQVPALYFVGEALDITGWLGGYNFQWAWASGWCAGQVV